MNEYAPDDLFASDRLEALNRLREAGVDPYPPRSNRSLTIGDYIERYADRDDLSDETATITLAGRVTRFNDIGGITFVDLSDESGSIQLFFREDDTADYEQLENIRESDYVEATGEPMRTNRGELSLDVDTFDVLSKALREPPSYYGLSEKNKIRRRAIGIRDDPELRETLDARFEIMRQTRDYLAAQEFTEVETPILQNIYGGAAAKPFTTFSNAKDAEMYLRIATELHLKRLIVGGYERIYEIGKVFRNEDIDTTHNPEFTMLELYQAYSDFEDMMDLTEGLVVHLVEELHDDYTIDVGEQMIDFSPPWTRMTMRESIREFAGVDVQTLPDDDLERRVRRGGGTFPGSFSRGRAIMELYDIEVEDKLTNPTFITHHPAETSPLCKSLPEDPDTAERFELVVGGFELANAYTELNDPIEQGERFAAQLEQFEQGDDEAHQMDEDFIKSLAHGMPPTGGLGIGMDRLVMLLTGSTSMKNVLPFPMVSDR